MGVVEVTSEWIRESKLRFGVIVRSGLKPFECSPDLNKQKCLEIAATSIPVIRKDWDRQSARIICSIGALLGTLNEMYDAYSFGILTLKILTGTKRLSPRGDPEFVDYAEIKIVKPRSCYQDLRVSRLICTHLNLTILGSVKSKSFALKTEIFTRGSYVELEHCYGTLNEMYDVYSFGILLTLKILMGTKRLSHRGDLEFVDYAAMKHYQYLLAEAHTLIYDGSNENEPALNLKSRTTPICWIRIVNEDMQRFCGVVNLPLLLLENNIENTFYNSMLGTNGDKCNPATFCRADIGLDFLSIVHKKCNSIL
ncbi:hypothetical protein LguiA_026114 [Lonicera macranthoides]